MSSASSMRLSVLVPTYNYARYIGEALDSVLDQIVDGVEIIVVDDGSTDDTESVLAPYVERGQIRYVRQDNSGVSVARNRAMAEARGTYLMFLDADDLLYPGCVEATLDFLERHAEVGFFFTNYDMFDETGVVHASGVDTWKVFRTLPHEEVTPGEWIFTESLTEAILRYGGFMHTSGLTVGREVAEAAGPFREGYTYGEDDDFYARCAYRTTSGYLDRVLSRKRNHEGSVIHDRTKGLRNAKNMLELTEMQLHEIGSGPALRALLLEKHRRLAANYCWQLIENRRVSEARSQTWNYLRRHPTHMPLYRLWVKALISGREK